MLTLGAGCNPRQHIRKRTLVCMVVSVAVRAAGPRRGPKERHSGPDARPVPSCASVVKVSQQAMLNVARGWVVRQGPCAGPATHCGRVNPLRGPMDAPGGRPIGAPPPPPPPPATAAARLGPPPAPCPAPPAAAAELAPGACCVLAGGLVDEDVGPGPAGAADAAREDVVRLASSRGLRRLLHTELKDHSAGVAAAAHLAPGAASPAHNVLLPLLGECVLAALVVVLVLVLSRAAHAWLARCEWAPPAPGYHRLHHPPDVHCDWAAS